METIVKLESVPDWLVDLFQHIDQKDHVGASKYIDKEVEIQFAHFQLKGVEQFIEFVGNFNNQFSEYHHEIEEIWVGGNKLMFGGRIDFILKEGSRVSTPFWDVFTTNANEPKKIQKALALFDLSALPRSYWEHLSVKRE